MKVMDEASLGAAQQWPINDALHEAALRRLAEADMTLARATGLPLTEPHHLDAVTADWLTDALGATTSGARVEALTEIDAHDGMTSRKTWRVRWNPIGRAAGLPTALFAKATPTKTYHRESIAVLHLHEAEANYYAILHAENPDLAPDAFYNRSYPGGRFLLLLEDLTARGCKPYWQADDCTIAHARAVATAQARFHARYWQSPRLAEDLAWVRPRTKRFGWSWLKGSFHEVRAGFRERGNEEELSPDMVGLLTLWDENAPTVFDRWDRLPRTVLHGDSHLGNTFAHPDGRAGYFDWQVMFAGHGLRDLAYFLMSALTDEDRRTHERILVDWYLDVLADGGVLLDRDQAWDSYCLFTFDRWDAVIKEVMKGGYGHARSAMLRSLRTITGCQRDNDMEGRLRSFLRRAG